MCAMCLLVKFKLIQKYRIIFTNFFSRRYFFLLFFTLKNISFCTFSFLFSFSSSVFFFLSFSVVFLLLLFYFLFYICAHLVSRVCLVWGRVLCKFVVAFVAISVYPSTDVVLYHHHHHYVFIHASREK